MNDAAPVAGRRPMLGLLGVVLLHVALFSHWMWSNGFLARPPTTDAAWHRLHTLPILRAAESSGLAGWLTAGMQHDQSHPPLMHLVTALISWPVHDITPVTIFITLALFSVIFVLGTYRFARNFVSPWAAVAATGLTMCCPVASLTFRAFYPQAPMAALVIWCFDALVRSKGLTRAGPTIALGVLGALATLGKQLAPLYLAGAIVTWLLLALCRREDRLSALRNTGLGLLVAGLIAGPWYWQHFAKAFGYAQHVVGSSGQAWFSGGVAHDSTLRWLYYLRHFAETGLGWPLTLALVFALSARLIRRRFDAADAALLATTAVAYITLTLGQIAAHSAYLITFTSLAATFIVSQIARSRPGAIRRLLAGGTAVAALATLAAIYRPMDADRDTLPVGPTFVVPSLDIWVGDFGRRVGAFSRPEAEPWPVSKYVDLILANARRTVPRVLETSRIDFHPFVFRPTIEYDLRRRTSRTCEWSEPGNFEGGDLQGAIAAVARADFLVLDERLVPLAAVDAALKALNLPHAVLSEDPITPRSKVDLVAIWRPWEKPLFPDASVLSSPEIKPADARWDNGWRLRGTRIYDHPSAVRVMESYWEFAAPAGSPSALPQQFTVLAMIQGNTRVDGAVIDLIPPPPGKVLAITTFAPLATLGNGARADFNVIVKTRRKDTTRDDESAAVTSSNLPARGPQGVSVTP